MALNLQTCMPGTGVDLQTCMPGTVRGGGGLG